LPKDGEKTARIAHHRDVITALGRRGGREIRIPIRTPEQRQLLDEAKAKGKSLVGEHEKPGAQAAIF
jgi:hypothetical protein